MTKGIRATEMAEEKTTTGTLFPSPQVDAILRLPEVERMSGLKRSAIYERMAEGKFPQSVPLGVRHVGWLESEVQEWIRELAAARKTAA